MLLKYECCRLLTHFIVDIHVRNPIIPQMDFHKLLIVLKTVPDQALSKKGIISPRHCLSSEPSSLMKRKMSCFCSRCPPPPPSPLHLSGRPILLLMRDALYPPRRRRGARTEGGVKLSLVSERPLYFFCYGELRSTSPLHTVTVASPSR